MGPNVNDEGGVMAGSEVDSSAPELNQGLRSDGHGDLHGTTLLQEND